MHQSQPIDIVILVPKEDELRALEWAFDSDFSKSDGKLSGGKLYYLLETSIPGPHGKSNISIAVVFINDQGNSITSTITEQVLQQLDPCILFLIGTAAGRTGRVAIGSVVVSSLIVDAQEWRIDEDTNPRTRHHEPPEEIRTDVGRFIGKTLSRKDWHKQLLGMPVTLCDQDNAAKEIWTDVPNAQVKLIASSNYLHLKPEFLNRVWDIDDRIRCIDMESGGFGNACRTSAQRQWLVIRGISDYGTPDSKKEMYRVPSAVSASIFLRMFIENGLVECHPHWLRVPESDKSELSSENFYAHFSVRTTLVNGIEERLGIDLSKIDLGRSLSLADFQALCLARGAERLDVQKVLSKIREDYFTVKYKDYTYENDLRGLIPHWEDEVKAILKSFSVNLATSVVLDVGAGNGLEIPYLFNETLDLIALDVSLQMLEAVKREFPKFRTVHNTAEDMPDIDTESIDVYISLRTYQSSLFDIPAALREAQRVLKPRGILIISIANGFVDWEGDRKKVVRGLLIPGSSQIVDRSTPRKIADQVVDKLTDFGFESIGYSSAKTDIYIWGQKP